MSRKVEAIIKEVERPSKIRVQPTFICEEEETAIVETVAPVKVPITRIEVQTVNGTELPRSLVDALTRNQDLERQVLQKINALLGAV
jgi:hypothetical protein